MAVTKQEVADVVKKFGRKENDSGSPEVQVALLTQRIEKLSPHFSTHTHDHSSKRGLLKMIGKRKSLLKYLQRESEERYRSVIKELGLRK